MPVWTKADSPLGFEPCVPILLDLFGYYFVGHSEVSQSIFAWVRETTF